MKTLLIVCPYGDKVLNLFSDIEADERVTVKYIGLKRPVYKYIKKAEYVLSFFGIQVKAPKCIYDFDAKKVSPEYSHILFRSNVLEFISISAVQEFRNRGIKCSLLLLDSVEAGSATVKRTKQYFKSYLWDEIITFDPVEAKKYGWTFIGWHFYSRLDQFCNNKPDVDLYLVTGLKGNRLESVNQLYNYLTGKGLSCKFDVLITSKKENKLISNGINHYRTSIPYSEVIDRVSKSKCILEILQDGQHGPSLRYFEAVFYNKKLLTNNPLITGYPYYNPDYMKVFSSVEDIDIDWIADDTPVDYNYSGEFSPTKLVDYLVTHTHDEYSI